VTRSRFPSPADDYVEGQIDLSRELVPSPMSTTHITVVGDAMSGTGLYDGDLVLYDRAKLPAPGRCVVAIYEGEVIVRKVQGRPPRVALVATDGITPPIWFGQGADPEILGVVIVGVHQLFK
jgi:DNA polymerase V